MKITDQGKLKLNTSKSVAIERFSELQGTYIGTKGSHDANLVLSCNRYGDLCIRYATSKYNDKFSKILSQLNAQIITENGETYVSYYTSMNNSRIFLVCGLLIVGIISFLGSFLFLRPDLKTLLVAIACIITLIFQISSIQNEKSNPYANSDIYVDALKKYIDAVDNWEK